MQLQTQLCALLAVAILSLALPSPSWAQLRTAPDIETPKNYTPGTGVDRNGIRSNFSGQRRTTNYVVPGGGYYSWGYTPGGYYFADDYYYNDYYLCPYCGSRWCNGYCRYRRPLYYPPIVGDAGALYGPRAIRDFLGVDAGNNRGQAARPQANAAPAPEAPAKISNPTMRARAWRFVEFGDRHFKNGDYRKAADRYRKAQTQADDIADIYFREGFAELGAGDYTKAVMAIREGLALKPNWPDSGFVLEELYPSAEAKREVFREMHSYVNEHPHDAEAIFLLAMLQHFDGQSEAAELRFRRVVELTGQGNHARLFLPRAPEAEDVDDLPGADGPLLPPQQ